jgi:hypothetical protein
VQLDLLQGVLAIEGLDDVIPLIAQEGGYEIACFFIIVSNQYSGWFH